MKKFLLVINGETFRHGPQGDRGRGSEESYDLQVKATNSHLRFINQTGLDCDIFMNIYKVPNEGWDERFVGLYGDLVKYRVEHDNLLGEVNLHNNTLQYIRTNIPYEDYDFILFIRPDLYLKLYFSSVFNTNSEKITFAHINEIQDPIGASWHKTPSGFPAVNHQIFYVPKKFFGELLDFKLWYNHYSYQIIMGNKISKSNIGFFVDTYHSSSTDVTWNPIFHQVGRKETKFWVDKKYRVNPITHEPMIVEDETIYSDLRNNDFNEQ